MRRAAAASAPGAFKALHLDSDRGGRSTGLVLTGVARSADTTEHGGKHENQASESAQLPCGHLLLLE